MLLYVAEYGEKAVNLPLLLHLKFDANRSFLQRAPAKCLLIRNCDAEPRESYH